MYFKEEVKAIIEEYDTPKNIKKEITKFIEHGNMHTIAEIYNKSN